MTGVEKHSYIEESFKTSPRRSVREAGFISGVHRTTVLHFLHNELKLCPYHLETTRRLSESHI